MPLLLAAAVKTSEYQLLKLRILDAVPLAKDAVHIYIGFLCFLVAVLVLRISPASLWAIVPGFLVSLAMEVPDLRDGRAMTGELLWGASVKDVVNTNLIPVLFVMLFRARGRPAQARDR